MFSSRTSFDRGDNPYAALVRRLRAEGQPICDLTLSNPTMADLPYDTEGISAALAAAASEPYEASSLGRLSSRQRLAALWSSRGVSVPAGHIALTASTSEAYGALFRLFSDPGGQVLVPEPSYPLLAELARYEAIGVEHFSLRYDGAWHIDFSSLEVALSDATRAIVVVSPNNPTGSLVTKAEFRRLASYGLPVISDEVFAAYGLNDEGSQSALDTETDGLVVALDGLSKLAGLPQLKLAWMTFGGNERLVEEAMQRLEFILDATLSVNGPAELALPRLLEAGETTRNAIRERLRVNLASLDTELVDSAASRLHYEAGWYAIVRLPSVRTDSDWASGLLEAERVLVQPGWLYDLRDMTACVLSLLTPPQEFTKGVRRLVEYVARSP